MKTIVLVVVMLWCVMTAGICQAGLVEDGTVKVGDLVWLKNANCFGKMGWASAMYAAGNLSTGQCGLTDKSTPGQWRLPTSQELGLIYDSKSQFPTVQPSGYWSSRESGKNNGSASGVNMYNDVEYTDKKVSGYYVWPVRSGP